MVGIVPNELASSLSHSLFFFFFFFFAASLHERSWRNQHGIHGSYGHYGTPGSYCQSGSCNYLSCYGGGPGVSVSPTSLVAVAEDHLSGIWFQGQKEKQPVAVSNLWGWSYGEVVKLS